MSIIISKDGDKAVRVAKRSIEKEAYLQEYIHKNPESIPLYDISEDIRLLILAREFATHSGPIDALGIDQSGEIYLIETKLYKNTDKRTVVAQALDYGAALWRHANDFEVFLRTLNTHTQNTFGEGVSSKAAGFFLLSEEETSALIERMRDNLDRGVFHFVVLMNSIDDRLKDLIVYVNQNSRFDIYAVELEYYQHDSYEIVIPRLFGAEVKKTINTQATTRARVVWTHDSFLEQACALLSSEQYQTFHLLYDYARKHANIVRYGSGKVGSSNPIWSNICDKSLFSLFANGKLQLNLHWLLRDDDSNKEAVDGLITTLRTAGFTIPTNYSETVTTYDSDVWMPKVEELMQVLQENVG